MSFTPPAIPEGPMYGEERTLTPVWVVLDALCLREPGAPGRVVIDGLDMTGHVRGLLSAWHTTAQGDWLGLVNFSIPYADEHRGKLRLFDQLVPAYALRPRRPTDTRPV